MRKVYRWSGQPGAVYVAAVRGRLGLRVWELAALLGVSADAVGAWERGLRRPGAAYVARLRALDAAGRRRRPVVRIAGVVQPEVVPWAAIVAKRKATIAAKRRAIVEPSTNP